MLVLALGAAAQAQNSDETESKTVLGARNTWLQDGAEPVARVRMAGKLLHLNGTQGEPDETRKLLAHQPDSISSDDPARLKQVLAKIIAGNTANND